MGLVSKLLGIDKTERGLDAIVDDAVVHIRAGQKEFVVAVRQADFPLRAGHVSMIVSRVVDELTALRLNVVDVNVDEWAQTAWLRVKVADTS